MCGITGIINLQSSTAVPDSVLERMTTALAHRGPDGHGYYSNDKVAFGHRRLSIIDLSDAGKQPMIDPYGNWVLSFNGEVYNYAEIKQSLGSSYDYHSLTDTEVILHAFNEKGIDCLQDFIGMFAFAMHENKSGKTYIIRDRIGIKPMYYAEFDGKLIFGSEVKAILEYPGFKTDYSLSGISSYLSYRYPIGDQTLYSNIKSLPPGHYLEMSGDQVELRQYYELPIISEKEDLGEDYYIEKLRELLTSAVKYRMISDVPFGAYLSGGLDSSIVVALMAKIAKEPIKTFTIGFEEEGYNEFGYAREVADLYQTDHHEILLSSGNYIDEMERLIGFKDAPLSVPNEPALHVMSAELKKYITVVLSGEGADEIFGGYGRIFRSPYDYERLKNPEVKSDSLKTNLAAKYGNRAFDNELDHFLFQYQYINWDQKQQFLSSDTMASLSGDNHNFELMRSQYSKLDELSHYDKLLWIFEKFHIVGLLHRLDMSTMATSVEGRVPFVDHRLVEFAMSMPFKYKIKWKSMVEAATLNSDQISEVHDIPKYILKKSFEKELTEKITWRKKVGFPVPIHKWLGGGFHQLASDLLLDKTAKSRGLYNSKSLEKLLGNKDLFKEHKFGLKVWMLVNLEMWLRRYF
ncbi:MAG: asparagine synthase (glutamine-hydrolyzing) [Cyclobacteriaceae bacterium]